MGGQFHEKFGNLNYAMGKRLDVKLQLHSAVCLFSFVQNIELSTKSDIYLPKSWVEFQPDGCPQIETQVNSAIDSCNSFLIQLYHVT